VIPTTTLPVAEVRAIAVDPHNAQRLYAAASNRGFYRSTNGGKTWTVIGGNLPDRITSLALVGQGTSTVFFIGTAGHGIFASPNGTSWVNASGFVNGALPTQMVAALVYDPHSGDQFVGPNGQQLSGALYAGTDQGVFKSIDEGQSWNRLDLHQSISALGISQTPTRLMLAIDTTGKVYRSRDGGLTWR
jgi:photosystem II stability/assembly factor-like uncharacterized protein